MPNSKHRQTRRDGIPGRQRSDLLASPPPPEITSEAAWDFVRLMHAGLPAAKAIGYIHQALTEDQCATLAKDWLGSDLAFRATVKYSKGEWHELDKDARLSLARDKFLAEQAYFLYTHSFQQLTGDDLSKAKYAHAQIQIYLAVTGSGDRDPLREFYKDLDKELTIITDEPPVPSGKPSKPVEH